MCVSEVLFCCFASSSFFSLLGCCWLLFFFVSFCPVVANFFTDWRNLEPVQLYFECVRISNSSFDLFDRLFQRTTTNIFKFNFNFCLNIFNYDCMVVISLMKFTQFEYKFSTSHSAQLQLGFCVCAPDFARLKANYFRSYVRISFCTCDVLLLLRIRMKIYLNADWALQNYIESSGFIALFTLMKVSYPCNWQSRWKSEHV